MPLSNAQPLVHNTTASVWNVVDLQAGVFPLSGQGSGGRPVAETPLAGIYRELTLLRQRGGKGTLTLSLTL